MLKQLNLNTISELNAHFNETKQKTINEVKLDFIAMKEC